MIVGAIVPKLCRAMLGLMALAWMLPASAVPDDRDARAPRWAIADLACAASDTPLPRCGDKPQRGGAAGNGSELLKGYLRRPAPPQKVVRRVPSSAAAGRPLRDAPDAALPGGAAGANDPTPVVHALRDLIAAMGHDAGADIPLAFVGRSVAGVPERERVRAIAAGFPFGALFATGISLSAIYQSVGARFDHVLFHVVDPQRLIAWNGVTPESTPEHGARAPTAGSLGALGMDPALWGGAVAGLETKPGEPGDKGVKKKRIIIYMTRGKTTVMIVEDPTPK